MDEFSNGKFVETETDEKLVPEYDAQDPKTKAEAESEFLTEILIESLKESYDAQEKQQPKEESCILEDLEIFEKEDDDEKEKEVINSIVVSDELTLMDSIEVKSEGIGEAEIESNGIYEAKLEPEGIDVGLLNGARETMWPEPTSDKPNASAVGLTETEDETPPSLVNKDAHSASATCDDPSGGIEKEVVSENSGLPGVLTRGIEEIKVEEKAKTGENSSVKKVDDSSKPSANAIIVGSNDAFPENIGNPHVISISQRTMKPTTWRSCCGLFEVLKRSNR